LDIVSGAEFVEACKLRIQSGEELEMFFREMQKPTTPRPEFIVIDTLSGWEQHITDCADRAYKTTILGRKYEGKLLDLPSGGGYPTLWATHQEYMLKLLQFCKHLILLGHMREKLVRKGSADVEVSDLDMLGKLKEITSAHADAIGICVRRGNDLRVSFIAKESTTGGNRCPHLEGRELTLMQKHKDGTLESFWGQIYPQLAASAVIQSAGVSGTAGSSPLNAPALPAPASGPVTQP
jgi:hypothetical protein